MQTISTKTPPAITGGVFVRHSWTTSGGSALIDLRRLYGWTSTCAKICDEYGVLSVPGCRSSVPWYSRHFRGPEVLPHWRSRSRRRSSATSRLTPARRGLAGLAAPTPATRSSEPSTCRLDASRCTATRKVPPMPPEAVVRAATMHATRSGRSPNSGFVARRSPATWTMVGIPPGSGSAGAGTTATRCSRFPTAPGDRTACPAPYRTFMM